MNILRRFISQISTPQEVDAAPENMIAKQEKPHGRPIRDNRCGLEELFRKNGLKPSRTHH